MNLRLRAGTASDWSHCLNLDVSYTTEDVWQLQTQAEGVQLTIGLTRVRLPRAITLRDPCWGDTAQLKDRAEGVLLVAETDAGLAGFCLLVAEPARNADLIPMLAVAGHARRRGIGRRLLAEAVQTARERRRRVLSATLQARNVPGIRFVTAGGFSFAGYDEHYYPSNDVAVFFAHRLRAA
jgi:ribosomal-protein-alanine N-acetyltransferase